MEKKKCLVGLGLSLAMLHLLSMRHGPGLDPNTARKKTSLLLSSFQVSEHLSELMLESLDVLPSITPPLLISLVCLPVLLRLRRG